ncbi:MAG: ATP-binding protein [Solirubrobacteraceae bacterium]
MSLRVRLGLAAGVAVSFAVVAVAVSAYAGTRSELLSQLDRTIEQLAQPAVQKVMGGPGQSSPGSSVQSSPGSVRTAPGVFSPIVQRRICGGADPDGGAGLDRPGAPPFGGPTGTFTLVCAGGGSYSPKDSIPVDARARALAASGQGEYFTDVNVRSTRLRVLVTGVGSTGALMVALPLTSVDLALAGQKLLLLLIAAGGIALAALLGMLVARTALAPIACFTRQTEAIAARPEMLEHERLTVEGGDELARLARMFNTTLDALARSVAAQRNLVADASHELRTPIATLKANLQLLRDEQRLSTEDRRAVRADMIEELDELTRLVADVVELARGTKLSGESGDVRLDQIAADAVERARRRAPKLSFDVALEPTLVRGEGERIARAISNLLDNACKWSPPGGAVEVVLRSGVLSVRDRGPGFNDEDLPFVFDRFHRARDARSKPGSGLGLAIVRQAAEAHSGFAQADNADHGGALMRVGFGPPLAQGDLDTRIGTERDNGHHDLYGAVRTSPDPD